MLFFVITNFATFLISALLLWQEQHWETYLASMISIWTYATVLLVFCILVLALAIFHMYLIFQGLSTYEWFILRKKIAEIVPKRISSADKSENTIQSDNPKSSIKI